MREVEGRLSETLRWQAAVYDRAEHDVPDLPNQYARTVDGVLQRPSDTSRYENRLDGRFFAGAVRNATRVPVYSRVDARADRSYRWRRGRLTLFAEVANVLDRQNFRRVPSSPNTRTGQVFDPLDSMFPIVPSIGATPEF
jgi:hypothetical protein